MMDFILVPLVVGIITLGIYKLFELFVCKKERIIMIEKLGDKFNMGDISGKFSFNVNYSRSRFSFSALSFNDSRSKVKWGGFSFAFPNYSTSRETAWHVEQQASLVYGACVLFFGGIGLISAFLIEMHIHKQEKES